MSYEAERADQGFTLVEFLVTMAITGIILAAVSSSFLIQQKTYNVQLRVTEMVENARAAMDMITREVRMAGYDPMGIGFAGIPYSSSQLQMVADLNEDSDTSDSNENIIYTYDSVNKQIDRNTGGGAQPFAEDIQAFTFQYLDSAGNTTTTSANIRQILVTITARTSEPDTEYKTNSGYRTYTLTSLVTPTNLGL